MLFVKIRSAASEDDYDDDEDLHRELFVIKITQNKRKNHLNLMA